MRGLAPDEIRDVATSCGLAREQVRKRFLSQGEYWLGGDVSPTDATVDAPAALATADAPLVTPAFELLPPAGDGSGIAPAATPEVSILPSASDATASAPAPSVDLVSDNTVTAVPAVVTASFVAPILQVTVTSPAPTATANALPPAPQLSLSAPAASATAVAPTVVVAVTVVAPTRLATASAVAPTVDTGVAAPSATPVLSLRGRGLSGEAFRDIASRRGLAPGQVRKSFIRQEGYWLAPALGSVVTVTVPPAVANAAPGNLNRIDIDVLPLAAVANATRSAPIISGAGTTTVAAPAARAIASVRSNLLGNSGIETNANGWTYALGVGGGTVTRVTSEQHSGLASLEVKDVNTAGGFPFAHYDEIPVAVGVPISAGIWVKPAVAERAQLELQWKDASHAYIAGQVFTSHIVLSAGWNEIKIEGAIPPAAAVYCEPRVTFSKIDGSDFPNDTIVGYLDDAQIEYGWLATTLIPTDGGASSGVVAAITVPVSAASATAAAPAITFSAAVVPPAATATSTSSAPSVVIEPTVSAPPGIATAVFLVPSIAEGVVVTPPTANATATSTQPALAVTVSTPVADATAVSATPTPIVGVSGAGPVAVGSYPVPTIIYDSEVFPPTALATATAPIPNVDVGFILTPAPPGSLVLTATSPGSFVLTPAPPGALTLTPS
jgi:hypothetical protein